MKRALVLLLALAGCPATTVSSLNQEVSVVTIETSPDSVGFVTTKSGKDVTWARSSIPIQLVVDKRAEGWLQFYQVAAKLWNLVTECELFKEPYVEQPPLFEFAETSTTAFGTIVPIFIQNASVNPHTQFTAVDSTGELYAASLWMPTTTSARKILVIAAMHELGHVLGLAHDNDNPASLMFPKVTAANVEAMAPTIDDVLRLKVQYCPTP